MSGTELRKYFILSFSVLFVCGFVFYKNPAAALVTGMLSVAGIKAYRNSLIKKRKSLLRLQFKDMLYSVSSSVMSGRHLGEAIEESEKNVALIHGKDCMLAQEIRNMVSVMKETNCSDEEVLTDFARRTHLEEVSEFADICITCRHTGGDLSKMIYKAVYMITQNIELQKEKSVMLSQKKTECKVLALMPVIVTAVINVSSSGYLDVMYETVLGRIIMTCAFAGTGLSFLWSLKMTESEVKVNAG